MPTTPVQTLAFVAPPPPSQGLATAADSPVQFADRRQYLSSIASVSPLVFGTVPESIYVAKWWQPASEPVRDVVRRPDIFPSGSIDTKQLTIGLGSQPTVALPKRALPGRVLPQGAGSGTTPQQAMSAMDQPPNLPVWNLPLQNQQYLWPAMASIDPKQMTLHETALVSKWWQPASEPVRDVARQQWLYPAWTPIDTNQLTIPSGSLLFRFWSQPSEPVRLSEVRTWLAPDRSFVKAASFAEFPHTGLFQNPEPPVWLAPSRVASFPSFAPIDQQTGEPTLVTKWWAAASEPVRDVARQQFLAPTFWNPASLPIPTVFPSHWFTQVSEPVRDLLRQAWTAPSSSLGTVLPLSQTAAFPDVALPGTALPDAPITSLTTPSMASWFVPTEQPLFDVGRRQYTAPSSAFTDWQFIETSLVSKWFVPTEQPLFVAELRRLFVPASYVGANFIEPNLLSKWFRATEQPIFDARRQQFVYPVFSFWPVPLPNAPGGTGAGFLLLLGVGS